jgi:hypothetical protein
MNTHTLKSNLSYININPAVMFGVKTASAANITAMDLNKHKKMPDTKSLYTVCVALHDCKLKLNVDKFYISQKAV